MDDVDKPAETPPSSSPRFSLERLSSAFARLMGTPKSGSAKKPQIAIESESHDGDLDADEPPLAVSPRMIVEGLLFVGRDDGRALSARELAAPIRNVEPAEVAALVAELNEAYRQDSAPYEIVGDAAGYRLQLRPEMASIRERMRGQQRMAKLTPPALEVLSIVAYRQPIGGDEVNKARGARSDAILAQLVRRQLLQVDRAPAAGGRPLAQYQTTDRFNRLFGVASPAELPKSEDLVDS